MAPMRKIVLSCASRRSQSCWLPSHSCQSDLHPTEHVLSVPAWGWTKTELAQGSTSVSACCHCSQRQSAAVDDFSAHLQPKMAGSIEVRAPKSEKRKKKRWKLEKKDNRIRRVSSNEHNGIQSYSGTRAGNVLHMSPSSICSRPATEQAHIAAETASLGILSHQQGHTQHNPLPLSFKLPKQAFPPLEACISSKTSPNQKLFWKSDTNIYNLHQSPASVATALERDCCPFPHLYSKVCESCTQIMRKAWERSRFRVSTTLPMQSFLRPERVWASRPFVPLCKTAINGCC